MIKEKRKIGLAAALSSFAVVGLTAVLILSDNKGLPFSVVGETNEDRTLVLDSSNAYSGSASSSGTTSVTTSTGQYTVDFSYTNASPYADGHVTLGENGTLVNKMQLKSVTYLQVDWNGSGKLQVKTSFDGATYGSYWDVSDNHSYSLPSNPYYLSFVATGGSVNITSVRYQFSCVDNPSAEGTVTGYEYHVVKSMNEVAVGDSVLLVGTYSSASAALTATVNTSTTPWYLKGTSVTPSDGVITSSSVTEWVVGMSGSYYTFSNSGVDLYNYISGTHYNINYGSTYTISGTTTDIVSSYSGINTWEWSITDSTTGNGYLRSPTSDPIYLCYAGSSYGTMRGNSATKWSSESTYGFAMYKKVEIKGYDTPKDLVGFSAVDGNKDNYVASDIYATANGLAVTASYSDGTTASVSSSDYTYKVSTDAAGENTISAAEAFPASGVYYVTVSYSDLIPSVIQINVGITPAQVATITPSLITTSYTTADTITYQGNLTASLTYDDESTVNDITYNNFGNYSLTAKLLNPSGVEYDVSVVLGTVGTWTIQVTNGSVTGTVTFTVSAVPVVSVGLDQASASVVEGSTVQLVATVNPSTATDPSVVWSTSDETVATVSDTGLVTGVKAGSATITVTTNDGSFTATCAITVTAKPVSTDPTLITDDSELVVGDKYVLACNSRAVTATDISSSVMGCVTSTFSSDLSTITSLGDNTVEFTLGGTSGAYTLTNSSDQLLGATAVKKLAWGSGTTTWTISIASSGNATITNGKSSYGTMYYNARSPRFTTYTSSQTAVQLYKSGTSTPIYATAISLPSTATAYVGSTVTLTPTFTPADTNQKSVTWTSSNESVATVAKGIVTGITAGTADITATVKDENGNDLTATCTVTVSTISVTSVSLSDTTATIAISKTKALTATVLPTNASNKNVTWKSSNTSVATVSSEGVVTGVAAGEATITVTTVDGSKTATCVVTVSEEALDPWTVLIYMCGADLESSYASSNSGFATGDLKEIASVSNQPDGVNIVVEAGGAKTWSSTYSSVISTSYLNRFHLSNNSFVKDEQITKANMGLQSTFQSFLTWGLNTYPAEKTAVIMWNHGGGMYGVCYDENYDDDSLSNSEVSAAVKGAFSSVGRTEKLEWIGYDACLMAVQDIAEFNSNYFNYMVCSEESESGYGWDYDTWVDDLFNLSSTTTILKAIVDGFITDQGGASSSSGDQTLSYLNLAYASAYKTAWENMASALSSKLSSSNQSAFCTLVNGCKYFADTDYTYFCEYDAKDFITKLAASSTLAPGSTYTDAVLTAFSNLVAYSVAQKGAGNAYGLCMFFVANSTYSSTSCASATSVYGSTSQTNFTTWRTLQKTLGYLKQ